jgi:hypothetical protein
LTIFVKRGAAKEGFVFDGSVLLVDVEDGGCAVAGDIEVCPAVSVEVSSDNTEGVVATGSGDAGGLGHVGELPRPVVPIEDIAIERKPARPAGGGDVAVVAVRILAGFGRRLEVELEIVGDEQIEIAVAIVIEESAAGVLARAELFETSGFGGVFEALALAIA